MFIEHNVCELNVINAFFQLAFYAFNKLFLNRVQSINTSYKLCCLKLRESMLTGLGLHEEQLICILI